MTRKRTTSSSKLNGVRAVLFDLEGVLDDHVARQTAIVETAMQRAGIRFPVARVYPLRSHAFLHEKKPFFLALVAINKIGAANALRATPQQLEKLVRTHSRKRTASQRKAVANAIETYTAMRASPKALAKYVRRVPGSRALLATLRARGIRTGIVTNANPTLAAYLLKKHGLTPLVDALVTGGEVRREKPHPEGVRLLLRKLNATPREAILVEDSLGGIQAGKRAHLRATVGVLTGNTKRNAFQRAGPNKPDLILRRAVELQKNLR